MTCATCCNCAPSEVVGNWVLSGVPLASAWVSAVASLMLLESVILAACANATPESSLSRLLSAFHRAWDGAVLLNPVSCRLLPGATATGCVDAPVPSREFPAIEKNTGKPDGLIFCASI